MTKLGAAWFIFEEGDRVRCSYKGELYDKGIAVVKAVTNLPHSQVIIVEYGGEPLAKPGDNFVPENLKWLVAADHLGLGQSKETYVKQYGGGQSDGTGARGHP